MTSHPEPPPPIADPMALSPLTAVSPVDGRYAAKTAPLRGIFSEYGLFRRRLEVEIRWLQTLANHPGIERLPRLSATASQTLAQILADFTPAQAARVKEFERETNHDVKAVEYFLREQLQASAELRHAVEFVHFACTTNDINNLSQGLMLAQARQEQLAPALERLIEKLCALAEGWAAQPMLSRTHGQPATPTTLGKELALFAHRLKPQLARLRQVVIYGKLNGASGNFNAHLSACPQVDWMALSADFVEALGLAHNPHTAQIEPHDYKAEYFQALLRANTIILDLCRDIWGYIALNYFRLRPVAGEVGSSTMPHKVNPIDFENAEGNLGLANALLGFMAEKLPVSRWQRDLSDSTVTRNMGAALAHCMLAYQACLKGLEKLDADPQQLQADLDDNPEVLAEAMQTVMRYHGIENPYEQLKRLTRGQRVTPDELRAFIAALPLPAAAREQLTQLTPATYTGNAQAQTLQIIAACRNRKNVS